MTSTPRRPPAPRLQIDAKSLHLDVTKEDSLEKFWTAASADGPVQMLVNNAGIMRLGPFVDQSLEGHHHEMAVNLGGVINGMHVFLPDMLARDCGHIVNVASMAAKVTTPELRCTAPPSSPSPHCRGRYAPRSHTPQ